MKIETPIIRGGIDSSFDATNQYFFGNGEDVLLGQNTVSTLLSSNGFLSRHERIVLGQTSSMEGSFSVNLTSQIFHVGRTNVDYSIACSSGNCEVSYNLFVRDGFWDPDFIDENILGRLGVESEQADGLGPNLERFGGTPYRYVPIIVKHKFPNPGY